MKFRHLKIIKIVATTCQILRLKCTKIDFGWSQTPSWNKRDLLLRGGEGVRKVKGKRGRERKGGKEGKGRKGKGEERGGRPAITILVCFRRCWLQSLHDADADALHGHGLESAATTSLAKLNG